MQEVAISTSDLPEGVESLRNPILVDREELDDLKGKASDSDKEYEDLRSTVEELRGEKDRVEELEDELEELRDKAEAVDEVKGAYAEELSESGLLDKEDYMEMEVSNLRSKVDDLEEAEENNKDPNPSGNSDPGDNFDPEEDEVEEEIASLKENIEWYEDQGWESNAEAARDELAELQE